MSACSEYLELISRYTDGDLSAEEAESLFAHLSHCPHCSEALSSFEELTMMTVESMVSPPAQLADGVKTSITAAKKRPWHVRYRFTAVAAVFALIILAVSGSPLAKYFSSPTENESLTKDSTFVEQVPTVIEAGSGQNAKLQEQQSADNSEATTRSAEPMQEAANEALQSKSVDFNAAKNITSDEALPAAEEQVEPTVENDTASGSDSASAEPIPESPEAQPMVDPALLPQTPYDRTFSKYLMFSANEAPEVLYSITSDQTVDNVIYYIVTSDQFTVVQSALLELGIELNVIPGDPESSEVLLILTLTK